MKEQEENNKLIAGFMGKSKGIPNNPKCKEERFALNGLTFLLSQLEYHTSWDWLMPVVEKIKSKYTLGNEHAIHVLLTLQTVDISKIYASVIQFITWFNAQQNEK